MRMRCSLNMRICPHVKTGVDACCLRSWKVCAKEVKSTWERCSFRKGTSCFDHIFFVR